MSVSSNRTDGSGRQSPHDFAPLPLPADTDGDCTTDHSTVPEQPPLSQVLRDPPPMPTDRLSSGVDWEPAFFGLRRRDQWFLAVLLTAALVLMICHWVRLSGWGVRPVEIERLGSQPYQYKIDVNQAPWIEWVLLDGIGETLARRIVENRRRNGPFPSVDDLRRVKGIGPKTLEKMRPQLTVTFDASRREDDRSRDTPKEPGRAGSARGDTPRLR